MIGEPILTRGKTTLMTLYRVECRIADALITSAKKEVVARRSEHAGLGVEWGYLLGLERAATAASFPLAWELCDVLFRDITAAIAHRESADFRFSFCKAYSGPVRRETEGVHYEGLHIDTHPDLSENGDLLRVLINVGTTERRFRFGEATRVELAQAGLYRDRAMFRADHVEAHVPMREVCIPAKQDSHIACLVFWASVVPHVGITKAPGYFLYSFEAVVASPACLKTA